MTLPSITKLAGYNTGFWSTSTTATSGTAAGTAVSLSGNVTYYAKARDTTKPVWSLVSTIPSSGTIDEADTLKVTFKGTDTSGTVTSTLTAANIAVKVGSTTVTPSTKTLSAATTVTNGKQYTLTLGGVKGEARISIVISANTLKDGSGNMSAATTISTGVAASYKIKALNGNEYVDAKEWGGKALPSGPTTSFNFVIAYGPSSNFVLDITQAQYQNGQNVFLYSRSGASNQKWSFVKEGEKYYKIKSAGNGNYYLDVAGWSSASGSNIQINTVGTDKKGGQSWTLIEADYNQYYIKSALGTCLTATGGSKDGSNVAATTFKNASNQKWYLIVEGEIA